MTAGPVMLLALTPAQHAIVREAMCSHVHLLEDHLADGGPTTEATARLAEARATLDALSHRRALPPGPAPQGRVWLPSWVGPWLSDCAGCGRQHPAKTPEEAAEAAGGCGCGR